MSNDTPPPATSPPAPPPHRSRACGTCPFRRAARPRVWSAERWASLAKSCTAQATGGDVRVMLCHRTPVDGATVCRGWASVVGGDAVGGRLAVVMGLLVPDALGPHENPDPALYGSFTEVFEANGFEVQPDGSLLNVSAPIEGDRATEDKYRPRQKGRCRV